MIDVLLKTVFDQLQQTDLVNVKKQIHSKQKFMILSNHSEQKSKAIVNNSTK